MSKPERIEDKADLTVVPGGSPPTSTVEVKLLFTFCFAVLLVLVWLVVFIGVAQAFAVSTCLAGVLKFVPRHGNGPGSKG